MDYSDNNTKELYFALTQHFNNSISNKPMYSCTQEILLGRKFLSCVVDELVTRTLKYRHKSTTHKELPQVIFSVHLQIRIVTLHQHPVERVHGISITILLLQKCDTLLTNKMYKTYMDDDHYMSLHVNMADLITTSTPIYHR